MRTNCARPRVRTYVRPAVWQAKCFIIIAGRKRTYVRHKRTSVRHKRTSVRHKRTCARRSRWRAASSSVAQKFKILTHGLPGPAHIWILPLCHSITSVWQAKCFIIIAGRKRTYVRHKRTSVRHKRTSVRHKRTSG